MSKSPHRRLCTTCEGIPFQKLVGKNMGIHVYELKSLAEMMKNADCPLCEFLVCTIASKSGQPIEALGDIEARCFLKGTYWASDRADKYIRLILGTDWAFVPSSKRNTGLSRYPVSHFDLLSDVDSNDSEIFTRCLLKDQINPEMLRGWYRQCQQNHLCKATDAEMVKKLHPAKLRLIDVVEMTLVEMNNEVYVEYVALSYVWGNIDQYALNADIFSSNSMGRGRSVSFPRNLSSKRLPRTIVDALQVTRILGLRYLWVDSICIDQNNTADKLNLISRMSLIYESASLTIVAAGGASADAGLSGVSTLSRDPELQIDVQTLSGRWRLVKSRPNLNQIIEESEWGRRAWTFQEHFFSSRCLFFSTSECFWTCPMIETSADWRESYTLEVFGKALQYDSDTDWGGEPKWDPSVRQDPTFIPAETMAEWAEIVEEYSVREVTIPTDVVRAIESMADRMWSHEHMACIRQCGLPYGFPHFFNALTWKAKCNLSRRISHPGHPKFPSWSWAGWVGGVYYFQIWSLTDDVRFLRKLIFDCEMARDRDIVCRANRSHSIWSSVKCDNREQEPAFESEVITLHFYTAYAIAKLKEPYKDRRDFTDIRRPRFLKRTRTRERRSVYQICLQTDSLGSAQWQPVEGTFDLDCSDDEVDTNKRYTLIIISSDLSALLLHTVDGFYERLGVGSIHTWGKASDILERYSFRLGWFSIR